MKRGKPLPTKPLSTDEIMSLLSACPSERDRMIILMLANTGARIAELAGMQSEDFDWERGLVVIRGKRNKERLLSPLYWIVCSVYVRSWGCSQTPDRFGVATGTDR